MSIPPAVDSAWASSAACADHPPRRFTDPADHTETRAALAVCRRCPVRQPCLETALARRPTADVGIWGGTTEPQRRHLRARTHDSRPATVASRDRRPPPPQRSTPQLTLHADEHGDLTDPTGRVLITRLPTGRARDYMVFLDGRPTTRTHRLADARQAAQAHLHRQPPGRQRRPTTAPVSRRPSRDDDLPDGPQTTRS